MKNKPKASKNLANDVETKPPVVMPREQPEYYALTGILRIALIDALLTSSPKKLSVGDVNNMCNALQRLRPISINASQESKEKDNEQKT